MDTQGTIDDKHCLHNERLAGDSDVVYDFRDEIVTIRNRLA